MGSFRACCYSSNAIPAAIVLQYNIAAPALDEANRKSLGRRLLHNDNGRALEKGMGSRESTAKLMQIFVVHVNILQQY